ncbi:MAG: preprotein translocase subunit SecE [Desulfobacterales bacterium]
MARMQKKKPADKKKKNKSAGSSDSDSNALVKQSGSADVAADVSAGTEARRKKQKTSYSGGARAGAEQTFVVRLINKYFGNWIQFLREVKVELARVTWPARKDTIMTTAVVMVFVFIVAIFLGIIDFALTNLVRLIL